VRFTAKLVGAALVACAALTVHPQAAMAAAADDTVNAIQRSAPEVLQDRVATLTTGAPTAVGQSVSVTLPSSTAEGVKIRRANVPDITVGLPSAAAAAPARKVAAGVVAFDNRDGSTTVPIVKSNGSVEIVTTISSSGAPSRYAYPVDLPKGAHLELTEYGGAVVVNSARTQVIATVDPAWAKDALGRSVATHYEVHGSTLVQVVEHKKAGTAYPVVADPWWGYQWVVSNATANRISALLYGGAGVSAIAAAICTGTIVGLPCGVAFAIAAGLVTIGGAAVSFCNANGRGIYINLTWNGWLWCSSR
jgi:hypothetical protein